MQIGLESIEEFEASLVPDDSAPRSPVAGSDVSATPPLLEPDAETSADAARSAPAKPEADRGAPSAQGPAARQRALRERWVGKRLSHFRLMRLIGSGTMGAVFQAEDVNLKRIVALKVLRKQMKGADSIKYVQRFLLEARAAAGIEHASIAQVFEINEHAGWWYIAMEFLEGGSLRDLIQASGPMAPGRAALLLADAARGLAAAHEAGVIHRDIKPANLMLNRRGRCKLVDFGLVKLDAADNPFQSDDHLVVGTPHYIAPEVVRRQGATAASDVYGLGVTLYTLLRGGPPFRAREISDVLRLHVEAEVPDVRGVVPNCSENMAALIQRSMAKDPALRPTAAVFAASLQTEVSVALAADPTLSSSSVVPVPDSMTGSAVPGSTPPGGQMLAAASATGLAGAHALAGASAPPPVAAGAAAQRGRRRWLWAVAVAAVAAGAAAGWWAWSRDREPGGATPSAAITNTPPSSMANTIGMRLVLLPAGRFIMGSPPTEKGRNSDERLVEVAVSGGVFMSVTEVTQAQWAAVMGRDYVPPEGVHPDEASGLRFLGDSLPAYASWAEAAEFCRRLSELEDTCYRLPTEAEWEYACRAGTSTAFHVGETLDPSQANIDAERAAPDQARPSRRPMPVASFPPNAWGLYDMHGNVMEWCADYKGEYRLGPLTDPTGPKKGTVRVLRGGSWDSYARIARSANRWANYPVLRTDYIGFRVVLAAGTARPEDRGPYLSDRPTPTAGNGTRVTDEPDTATHAVALDPDLPDYQPEVVLDQRLRSVGSDTMDRLILLWESEFQKWHQQVVFRHEGRGSGTAVPALVEGLAHIGPMSRPLRPAERREFQSEYGYEPTQVRVATDTLAVYVHPANPVVQRGLTLAELDAVFSTTRQRGHAKDVHRWGDLGLGGRWSRAPVRLYSRNRASGTYTVFRETALLGGTFKPSNYELVGSAEVVAAVAGDASGIGYSGIGYARPGVAVVPLATAEGESAVAPTAAGVHDETYPLSRPLYLTLDRPPGAGLSPLHREFLRFVLSRQGQEFVVQAGFYPLSAELAAAEARRIGLRWPASP